MSDETSGRASPQPSDPPQPNTLEELRQVAHRLSVREQQQAAVASLGLLALQESDLQTFMDFAAREVQRTLAVDAVKILELQPDGEHLLLRAGVGWKEGLVGSALLDRQTDAQAFYTLSTESPVIVEDLNLERRFVAPGVLLEHNVRSGISCVIRDGVAHYGVIGTHSQLPRHFRREDTDFIVAVAAVMTAAIHRHQTQLRLALETAMARAQADSTNLREAAARIHTLAAETAGNELGELWEPKPQGGLRRTLLSVAPHLGRAGIETLLGPESVDDDADPLMESMLNTRGMWLSTTSGASPAKRAQGMRALGIQSGLAIPIADEGRPLAVLTLFSSRRLYANGTFLRGLEVMGRGLGDFVSRRAMEARIAAEQKRANEALAASERRFRATFENAAVGMAHVSLSGQWLRVNNRLLEILGYSHDELLERTFQSMTHPDHLERDVSSLQELVEGRTDHYSTEKRYFRRDGSTLWVNVTAAVVRTPEGSPDYFITVVEDIEQRKRSAAELLTSELRFRQMVLHSPVPLMVFDEEGTIVALSRSWTDLSGYRPHELPNIDAWLRLAYRDDPTDAGDSVRTQWSRDDATDPTERDIWTADGSRKTLLIQTMPLGESDATPRLRICAAADITAQRQAARELQEASRQKDEFLAMLSHELRNPLSAVRSALELIKLVRGHDPDLKRPVAVLERQSEHIAKLLDGLLDLSRVIRGSIVLDRVVLDVRRTIQDVAGDHAENLKARQLQLTVDLPDEPVWLDGDPVRMTQVVDNLLSNASKYTEPSGSIRIELRQEDSMCFLTVSDTGLGIEPELLPHVFDTFRQARQNLDRAHGGLGLGLALVKTLVERHHGTVTAHSQGTGLGSQFVVTLPLSKRPRIAATSSAVPAADPLPRILIVEDNEDAAEMLEQALRIRGYDTQLASYGQQAIEMSLKDSFDVVLCDVGLPMGMSGFDVARELRRHDKTHGIKLVALTGYGTPEDRRTSEEAGFDAHLTKPVDFRLLTQTLSDLFAASSATDKQSSIVKHPS